MHRLSPREHRVLRLLADGHRAAAIAERLASGLPDHGPHPDPRHPDQTRGQFPTRSRCPAVPAARLRERTQSRSLRTRPGVADDEPPMPDWAERSSGTPDAPRQPPPGPRGASPSPGASSGCTQPGTRLPAVKTVTGAHEVPAGWVWGHPPGRPGRRRQTRWESAAAKRATAADTALSDGQVTAAWAAAHGIPDCGVNTPPPVVITCPDPPGSGATPLRSPVPALSCCEARASGGRGPRPSRQLLLAPSAGS
jgi:hypothetical protein